MSDPSAGPGRPQFSQIDAWGLTHRGKVRRENQDHFLVGSLTRGVSVDRSSLSEVDGGPAFSQRMASLAVVADGVGGSTDGEAAARVAVKGLVETVSRFYHEADAAESEDPEVFSRRLQEAALHCHEQLVRQAGGPDQDKRLATTVTLFLGQWPHAYLLQVGDSRCYLYMDDELRQITRDQTYAEELVRQGVLTRTQAEGSRWSNVLSSAIGGTEAAPVVTRVVRQWGAVVLLCSDGLTKHVPDERIRERLANLTSSRAACEALLQDALDAGGSDNITVVIGRTIPPGEGGDP